MEPPTTPPERTTSPPDASSPDAAEAAPAHIERVAEIIRHLTVAEKNFRLYPPYSKVVVKCLSDLCDAFKGFHEAAIATLQLKVTSDAFLFDGTEVYREEQRGKSMSFRLYKDGVRGILVHPDVDVEEISKLVLCFKEVQQADEEDDDFATLFWEKDCKRIQLQLIDETEASESEVIPDIPERHLMKVLDRDKFNIPKAEEEKLRQELERRIVVDDDSQREFELTDEEIAEIDRLAENEENYFAIHDFVDVLIELMVSDKAGSQSFRESLKITQSIVFGLVENLDFEHAGDVLSKLSNESHPGLTETHLAQIRELVENFCDTNLMDILGGYLRETDKLPPSHALFKMLRSLSSVAVPRICELLECHQHIPALSSVLCSLGKNRGAVFAKHLENDDPIVARAMVNILLETQDPAYVVDKLSKALEHPDERVRKHAAKTLHDLEDPRAGQYFVPLLTEDNQYLQSSALRFLSRYSCPAAADGLTALIQSKSFLGLEVVERSLAFKGLFQADRQKGMKLIQSNLKNPFCFTRRQLALKSAALLALAQFAPVEAVPLAKKFAAKPRSRMADPARQALKLVEQKMRLALERKKQQEAQAQSEAQSEGKAEGDDPSESVNEEVQNA